MTRNKGLPGHHLRRQTVGEAWQPLMRRLFRFNRLCRRLYGEPFWDGAVALLVLVGLAHASTADLMCERAQPVFVGGDVVSDNVIELVWRGRSYRMQRVGTTTGAQRFEDPVSRLIWISIPSKSMLLDGGKGEPIVSDCKILLGGRAVR